jgi:endo-1,4-beta-D-glucanase Y
MFPADRFRGSNRVVITSCFAALALVACAGSETGVGNSGSGGTSVGTGGSPSGTGGGIGTGGTSATGGTGGLTGTGGVATGGAIGTGGVTGTGGTAGHATGGATSTGGAAGHGTGGATSTGGAAGHATGGATSTGGQVGTGGAAGAHTGGASGATGGASGGNGSSSATTTIPGNGCTAPAAYGNLFISLLGETQAQSDAKVAAAWSQLFSGSGGNTIFYTGPGAGEAYVEDVADNAVRSEGQSYGMMIALQLNHQTEFDELWTFVKNHMWKSGNTISWQTSTSGSVTGSGGAPDGDEWFAAALVFAHNRWGDTSGKYNYGTEAQKTLDLVRTTDFNQSLHLVRYYTGTDGNGTDASYMLPAFYQTWACFDTANAAFWNSALTATRAWLQTAAGSTGNIGDQSSFAGQTTNSGGDDKLRTIANFMSDYNFFAADPFEVTYGSEYATWVASNNNGSTAMTACNALMGFALPAATGKPFVQKLWSAAIPTGTYRYYDGALYTIGLLHASGTFHLWY